MKKQIIAALVIAITLAQNASAVSIIPASPEKWTCHDWSVNFTSENPDWGIVTYSDNQWFNSHTCISHMVNYQMINETTLLIHDGLYGIDYVSSDWQERGFYHFWVNETPVRNYRVMQDNRMKVIGVNNTLNKIFRNS